MHGCLFSPTQVREERCGACRVEERGRLGTEMQATTQSALGMGELYRIARRGKAVSPVMSGCCRGRVRRREAGASSPRMAVGNGGWWRSREERVSAEGTSAGLFDIHPRRAPPPPDLSLVEGCAVSPSAAALPLLRSCDARRRAGAPPSGVWIIAATDARPSIIFFTPVRVDGTCDFRPPWTGAGTAGF